MFTKEQIEAAKRTKAVVIEENIAFIKSIYMAGEICMWDEMQAKIIGEANAQANVSGNEANQPSIKKDGEVAVAFAEWIDGCGYSRMIDRETFKYIGWTEGNETIAKNTEELFEIFLKHKSAKATDC